MTRAPGDDRTGANTGFDHYRAKLGEEGRLPPLSHMKRPVRTPEYHPSDRPNVLWIMADQLRADTLGFIGHPLVKTPNLDRLAARSAVFTRSYCDSPVCAPSRASMLTARHLPGHGVLSNRDRMTPGLPLLPRLLADAGYRTANIGKHHAGTGGTQMWEYAEGVEDVFGATKPTKVPFLPKLYPDALYLGGEVCDSSDAVIAGTYPGPVETSKSYHLTTAAMRWLHWNDDPRPFFLRVSYDDPHPPIVPPEPFASMYRPEDVPDELIEDWAEAVAQSPTPVREFREFHGCAVLTTADHRRHAAAYFGLVSHLDAQIGRLLDYFEQTPFAESTIILMNSDHGHMIGDHAFAGKGVLCYEGVARIPTTLAVPGMDLSGRQIDELVEGVDVMPTLLDLLDIPTPDGLDGQSWRPLLERKSGFEREYARIQWHDFGHCLCGRRYKLTTYDTDPADAELYDLQEDPWERRNLFTSPAHAAIRDRMLAELGREP
jgi:arylsulfatase